MSNKEELFLKYKEYKAKIIELNDRQLELDKKIKILETKLDLEQRNDKK